MGSLDWWRVRSAQELDDYGDYLAHGACLVDPVRVFRYGAWLPDVMLPSGKLVVADAVRDALSGERINCTRVTSMTTTEPHVDWRPWLLDWDRSVAKLMARLGCNDPEELVLPYPPGSTRHGWQTVDNPGYWLLRPTKPGAADDEIRWSPRFPPGLGLEVRGRLKEHLEMQNRIAGIPFLDLRRES